MMASHTGSRTSPGSSTSPGSRTRHGTAGTASKTLPPPPRKAQAQTIAKLFNNFYKDNGEPNELKFKFTNVDDNPDIAAVKQTIIKTLGIEAAKQKVFGAPDLIKNKQDYSKNSHADLEVLAKQLIDEVRMVQATHQATDHGENPLIHVDFGTIYTLNTLNILKNMVLTLLCQTYTMENGVHFAVEPAISPVKGTLTVADITLPGYRSTDDEDNFLLKMEYWQGYYAISMGVEPPTVLDIEQVKIEGYWHIFYLFDNIYKEYPKSRFSDMRFSVKTDTNYCVFCRKIGHIRSFCPTAPGCNACGRQGHMARYCPPRKIQQVGK